MLRKITVVTLLSIASCSKKKTAPPEPPPSTNQATAAKEKCPANHDAPTYSEAAFLKETLWDYFVKRHLDARGDPNQKKVTLHVVIEGFEGENSIREFPEAHGQFQLKYLTQSAFESLLLNDPDKDAQYLWCSVRPDTPSSEGYPRIQILCYFSWYKKNGAPKRSSSGSDCEYAYVLINGQFRPVILGGGISD